MNRPETRFRSSRIAFWDNRAEANEPNNVTMIFVPLPLFASLALAGAFAWFVANRDMTLRPHQVFASLVLAYCIQSFLLCLRWGYGLTALQLPIAVLAPVLPALAWFAFQSLSGQTRRGWWLPLVAIGICWLALVLHRDLADIAILIAYFTFGTLLLVQARKGETGLALSPAFQVGQILLAMVLTGVILILSGTVDIFVIHDFLRNDGQNIGLAVSLAQVAFVLIIGIAATFARTSVASVEDMTPAQEAETTAEDAEILSRLEALFENHLHRVEDLSLRKLARRAGVPDRRVSNVINQARNMNVSQFINEFRIKDACELLSKTDQGILQVSIAVGFASKSNFNREFVRVTGETPSQWRKQNSVHQPAA